MNTVYTIGYEGTDIERFVQTLKAVGIEVLADVRAVALSRKKGFSKTALRNNLAEAGIEYIHLNALGTRSPVAKQPALANMTCSGKSMASTLPHPKRKPR